MVVSTMTNGGCIRRRCWLFNVKVFMAAPLLCSDQESVHDVYLLLYHALSRTQFCGEINGQLFQRLKMARATRYQVLDATGGVRWPSGDRAELNDKRPVR